MTTRNPLTGEITINPDALRTDLETTPIKADKLAEPLFHEIDQAIQHLRAAAIPMLLAHTDATEKTYTTIAEAEEILINIKVRLDLNPPE
jgi:hypothetical protein